MNPKYPSGTVRDLLPTELITEATRDALLERLLPPPADSQFFTPEEMHTLRALCAVVLPQPDRAETERIDVAAAIDARLAKGEGDGWRYDVLPADGDAYRQGLRWLNDHAQMGSGVDFADAPTAKQEELLTIAAHDDDATLPLGRWFEDFLCEASQAYYAHPLAQEEIGYVGMADAPGWHRIGLNELEPREPLPLSE